MRVPGSLACSRASADGRALLLSRLLPRLCACAQVGVLPIRGPADAFKEFNETFATYLTCEMKCRYSPPVTFEMVPITFKSIFSSVLSTAVDFIYVNPSAYSCIESEFGASRPRQVLPGAEPVPAMAIQAGRGGPGRRPSPV